jgi:hypothetical protein
MTEETSQGNDSSSSSSPWEDRVQDRRTEGYPWLRTGLTFAQLPRRPYFSVRCPTIYPADTKHIQSGRFLFVRSTSFSRPDGSVVIVFKLAGENYEKHCPYFGPGTFYLYGHQAAGAPVLRVVLTSGHLLRCELALKICRSEHVLSVNCRVSSKFSWRISTCSPMKHFSLASS